MCLLITKSEEPIVAHRNILVYKELNNNCKSSCFGYQYVKGVINPTIEIVPKPWRRYDWHDEITEAYHSRLTSKDANAIFIIPKGALYYIGGENDSPNMKNGVASSSIIWVGWKNFITRLVAKYKYDATPLEL